MKNKKKLDGDFRGKRIASTVALFVLFFSLNTASASQNVLTDQQKHQIPALNSDESTKQIPVSGDDVAVNDQSVSSQGTQQVTGSDTAKALAYGYVKAGKDKKTIIGDLQNMGYSSLESEVAYTKAVTQLSAENNTTDNTASVTTQTAQTAAQQTTQTATEDSTTTPQKPALQRLQEGIGKKPVGKFLNVANGRYSKESSTVKDMVKEGYSADDIAGALSSMGYKTAAIAKILNKAGVSGDEAYSAISKISLTKAENDYNSTHSKPSTKFIKLTNGSTTLEQAKQDAIKGVLTDLKSAGYSVTSVLDGAMSDFKAAGMSAKDAFNQVIKDVGGAKPTAKFIFHRTSPQFSTYGEGEVDLAKAMLKAGYSETDVSAAFQNKNGTIYGSYSYTQTATNSIISAANKLLNQTGTGTV